MMASVLPGASCNLHKLLLPLTGLTGEADITRAKAPWPHPRVSTQNHNSQAISLQRSAVSRRFMDASLHRIAQKQLWKGNYSILTCEEHASIFHFTGWVCFSNSCHAIFAIVVVYTIFLGKLQGIAELLAELGHHDTVKVMPDYQIMFFILQVLKLGEIQFHTSKGNPPFGRQRAGLISRS